MPENPDGTGMFSRRIPLPDLIDLCRVLRHQLGAGLALHQVLKKQGERGRNSVRVIAGRLAEKLLKGISLSDALDAEVGAFPPLFLSMANLGETTGHLTEVFGELERYYQLELQMRRQFRSASVMPSAQFVFAVLVVAAVIWILGIIGGNKPLLTFFGIPGGLGAAAFLCSVSSVLALIAITYLLISRIGRQKVWMDRFLLAVPALGPCLYSLAMSRFTLALQLTLDSGLSITKGLRLSLEATGNAHFAAHADAIVNTLKNGQPLHEAIEASKLFTSDFVEMIVSSEIAGSVPEMMRHLQQQYHEETARRMTMLTRVAAGAVWLAVATFIVIAIFKLASIYFDALAGVGKI